MMDSRQEIKSLKKALRALTFMNQKGDATVTDVARAVGIPRTTAHRVLATLASEGYVEKQPPSDYYRITSRVQKLAAGFQVEQQLLEVAKSLKVTPSRVSQIYHSVVRRVAIHFGNAPARATDRYPDKTSDEFAALVRQREEELHRSPQGAWDEMMEQVLTQRRGKAAAGEDEDYIEVTPTTRWG